MIETLLRFGADVNAVNGSGKDSLMLACFAGHLPVVKLLRSYKATYESRDKGGSTAMHWAVDGGNVALIQSMIADDAPVCKPICHPPTRHFGPLYMHYES